MCHVARITFTRPTSFSPFIDSLLYRISRDVTVIQFCLVKALTIVYLHVLAVLWSHRIININD